MVEFDSAQMANLTVFDLSTNLIAGLGTSTQSKLERLAKTSTLSLNLFENPLQCSCDTIGFLQWQKIIRVAIYKRDYYKCICKDEEVQLDTLSEIWRKLQLECSIRLIVGISAGSVAFVSVVIAVSVRAYRHKWDIHFLVLQFVIKKKKLSGVEQNLRV